MTNHAKARPATNITPAKANEIDVSFNFLTVASCIAMFSFLGQDDAPAR